jgi:hypothetical protein
MKQGQSRMMRSPRPLKWNSGGGAEAYCYPAYEPPAARIHHPGVFRLAARAILGVLGAFWTLLTLPIRLVVGLLSLLGRLTGIFVGFSLMVVGMALWAGPLFILGIPLFLIGLLLTLRCLD